MAFEFVSVGRGKEHMYLPLKLSLETYDVELTGGHSNVEHFGRKASVRGTVALAERTLDRANAELEVSV